MNEKNKKISQSTDDKSDIWKDERFSHLVNDPRFKQLPQAQRKVKIDKRFQPMFENEKFKLTYSVDKYGRKVNKTTTEDLHKYYDISEDSEEEESTKTSHEKDEDGNDILQSDDEIPEELKQKLKDVKVDYARGHGVLMSDSSSDDDTSEDEDDDELFIEHVWGELDHDAPRTDKITTRLAACNMDWDRMRAVDIMVLCNSFVPSNGSVMSVKIYPSEFGKQRMAEEDAKGPQELREFKIRDDDNDDVVQQQDEEEEGSDYHMEKLREYQLNRLKYFYAVIECDSCDTADKLYKECDGMEYESTATKLDLRFIPDDVKFDDDTPHDVCNQLPDLAKYQPRTFTTTALQQVKVELTWDETDLGRKEITDKLSSGKLNEIDEHDLKNFIAYSSEEEDDDKGEINEEKNDDSEEDGLDKEDSISKYKNLLLEIKEEEDEKKKNQIEREMTWGIGVQDKVTKQKLKDPMLTPFEKIIEKKKIKQKARKEDLKKLMKKDKNSDNDDDNDLPDGIDMNDPYFAEEFANGEFEDLKKPSKKKNKSKNKEIDPEEEKRNAELELLVDDDLADDGKSHFSLKKILDNENESKSKRKKKFQKNKKNNKPEFEDNFEINVDDKRFSAVYTSHLYNIDPTDSHFKKTKGMEIIINEKLKRRRQNSDDGTVETETNDEQPKTKKKDVAVNMLVKSIKRKVGGI